MRLSYSIVSYSVASSLSAHSHLRCLLISHTTFFSSVHLVNPGQRTAVCPCLHSTYNSSPLSFIYSWGVPWNNHVQLQTGWWTSCYNQTSSLFISLQLGWTFWSRPLRLTPVPVLSTWYATVTLFLCQFSNLWRISFSFAKRPNDIKSATTICMATHSMAV